MLVPYHATSSSTDNASSDSESESKKSGSSASSSTSMTSLGSTQPRPDVIRNLCLNQLHALEADDHANESSDLASQNGRSKERT